MNKGLYITLGIIGAIVVIGLIWGIASYNHFVSLDQKINGEWSEVENQYQRQADLIPNLVSVVSSSVSVETKFVKDVIAARTQWQGSQTVGEKDTSGVQMANSVATFVNAVAENYPQLQANTQYVALTDELAGTQNRIAVARGRYIQAIQTYNTAAKKFPSNMIAGMFGFSEKEYYHADVNALKTPQLGTGQLPQ
jgi:LemA protein